MATTAAGSTRKRAVVVGSILAAAMVSISPLAGAHGGATNKVHACVVSSSGTLRVVGPDDTCRNGERPLDWSLSSGTVIGPGTITGEGNNDVDGTATGNLALRTVGRENLVLGAVDTAEIANQAVTSANVSANDSTNLTSDNIRTGTLRGTLHSGNTSEATTGDIGLGTISGQGDNDDPLLSDDGAVTGNLGLQTVGRGNIVNGAIEGSKIADGAIGATHLSQTLLGDLVTEEELTALRGAMKQDERDGSPRSPNDLDGFVHWNNLEGVPASVLNAGQEGIISSVDIQDGAIRAVDLAGSDSPGQVVIGAVTSEKIADGTIAARDLAGGAVTLAKLASDVINRFVTLETRLGNLASPPAGPGADRVSTTRLTGQVTVTAVLDTDPVGPMTRVPQVIGVTGLQLGDLVTVSPPSNLHDDLLFVGHDVQEDGQVVLYLYNTTDGAIDDVARTWKIQYLDLTP